MGHGVVQMCAANGYNVIALDLDEKAQQAALDHIEGSLSQLAKKALEKVCFLVEFGFGFGLCGDEFAPLSFCTSRH